MPCQVGMTTDPDRRRREWERIRHVSNWRIVDKAYSKSDAQDKENYWAGWLSGTSGEGGDGPEVATWYIYAFEYTNKIIR